MPKYTVTAYYTTPWTIEVEAENADEAEELGMNAMFYDGEGIERDGEWLDELDVEEEE